AWIFGEKQTGWKRSCQTKTSPAPRRRMRHRALRMGRVMAETRMIGVRFLPALMVAALICVLAALGLLMFAGKDAGGDVKSVRETNELLALSQKLPLQANAALS